jgi:tRNA 2-thiouridine synthesizing protein A
MTITVNRSIDLKGLLCPMPVIKVAKAIREMNVGETLEGLATDPAIAADIPAWCRTTGHELVSIENMDNQFHFFIRKTR